MSEIKYSENEINETWNDLNLAKKELEELERKNEEPKKELIIRIRDRVEILVKAKKIPIKENQISDKVRSILKDAGVTYSRGHWHKLFKENQIQKRNYSVAPEGAVHEHCFEVVADIPDGKWEQCKCGTNRLNGIEQLDKHEDDDLEESKKKLNIRELIEPQGIQFEYLKFIKELFSQNIHAIDTIFQKCTLDITSIKKQTIENKKRQAPQVDYEKLYNATKFLADKRIDVVLRELSEITEDDIESKKKAVSEIMNAQRKLNDRTKITNYEKAVAKILINKFAYFDGEIAGILNITTKHIKNNILKLNATSPEDQDSMLEQLDFLVRCPKCGVGVADHFETLYQEFKSGRPIQKGFRIDSFPLSSYQEQVIGQKQKMREQKIIISQKNILIKSLKEKIKSKK